MSETNNKNKTAANIPPVEKDDDNNKFIDEGEPIVDREPVKEGEREVLIELKDVDITFYNGKRAFKAVKDATFKIYRGETFALVGESGSGKTTIGRAIIGLNPTSKGDILFKGQKINGKLTKEERQYLVRNIQMIFQDPAASLNERATVDYCIAEGLDNFHLYKDKDDRRQKVDNALKSVGLLPEHRSRYPHEFSGGQRQRIGVARAIIMEPSFIVADEPISALDVSIRAQVLNLMNKFQEERGLTYMFIAHDLSVVRYFSDRIAVIHKGVIVEIAETWELFRSPLHPYTHSLLQSVPMPDPMIEKKKEVIVYHGEEENPTPDMKLREIVEGHYVFCHEHEIEEYKKKREQMIKDLESQRIG